MERVESHKAGFPPFPHSLEIPSGFPHFHGLDGGLVFRSNGKDQPQAQFKPRKGLVTEELLIRRE
jgi:hypothetical protein